MIDERLEELASLYVLDLLEGAELAQFVAALSRDRELQALVVSLRNTSTTLAHTAPSVNPPAALKTRIMASLPEKIVTAPVPDNVVRPPQSIFRSFIPWAAAAACLALGAAWLGQRYASSRSEADSLRNENRLAEIALKSTRQQLEAERILSRRQLQDTTQQLASATTDLENSRTQLTDRERLLAEGRNQLTDRDRLVADRERLLADRERLLTEARAQVADRERQVATLTQRVDALASASVDLGRQFAEAKQQVAKLTSDLKTQGDLASFKITTLASMLKNSPQAIAVAVWDPAKQEGVLKVEKLPALLANQDYQLWVVDPQYPDPVDGGVFTVDPVTGTARVQFKGKQPIGAVNAFAVTLERKGGVPKAEGKFVLLGK